MKKKCSQIEREILASDDKIFSQAIKEHCAECESCRKLKDNWQTFSQLKPVSEISLTNDFAVIQESRNFTRSLRRQVVIRRVLGYTAAAASGIAALYTVIFNGNMPDTSDNIFHKAWNWDSFEERVFVLDTAAEVSHQDITLNGNNEHSQELHIEEINFEQL